MSSSTVLPEEGDAIVCSVSDDFTAVRLLEVELTRTLPVLTETTDLAGQPYHRAQCLVRLHAQPLGLVEVPLESGQLSATALAAHIWQTLGAQINSHLREDGLEPVTTLTELGLPEGIAPRCIADRERFLATAPFVSVVIATRERPHMLQRCLDGLLAQRYPHYEIIVVDNAPLTSTTADLIAQHYQDHPSIRYVREDLPGLSRARNRGLQEASGEFLAITDDDVVIDSHWLLELMRDFQLSERVACVTGMILPLEIETKAQAWFEQYGGYNKGFARRLFNKYEHHPGTPLFPYTAGQLGTGANIAFRTSFLRKIGGFDPALGTGTPALGGEDLAIFFQIVALGYTLVYEPAALLYHPNRRDYEGLRKLMYCYGAGLTAYLMKVLVDNPLRLFDLITRLPYGLYFTLNSNSPKNNRKLTSYPKELSSLERRGMCYGPFAYIRSKWALRKGHQSSETR